MSEAVSINGSCLCGAVSFTTSNFSKKVCACHCGMCRK
ncbi:GFA family protein [Vacuolonema iberomarrocanum]